MLGNVAIGINTALDVWGDATVARPIYYSESLSGISRKIVFSHKR